MYVDKKEETITSSEPPSLFIHFDSPQGQLLNKEGRMLKFSNSY